MGREVYLSLVDKEGHSAVRPSKVVEIMETITIMAVAVVNISQMY
jgi:hypothetical protein